MSYNKLATWIRDHRENIKRSLAPVAILFVYLAFLNGAGNVSMIAMREGTTEAYISAAVIMALIIALANSIIILFLVLIKNISNAWRGK